MKIFRDYKDPTILESQFQPLYKRLTFLFEISDASEIHELEDHARELTRFVSFLEMGKFYSDELTKLIGPFMRVLFGGGPEDQQRERAMIDGLVSARGKVLGLIVELLRYQKWATHKEDRKT